MIGTLGYRDYKTNQVETNVKAAIKLEPIISLSPSASHIAVIPFHLSYGHIVVTGTSGGKTVQCLIDTGASSVQWSDTLGLAAKPLGVTFAHQSPYYTLAPRPAQWMLLKELRIGPLDIRACPGLAYAHLQSDDNESNMINIGNSVFAHFVVTIDYQKHELLIRRPGGSVPAFAKVQKSGPHSSAQQHSARTYVFNFEWQVPHDSSGLQALGPGQAILAGSIGGHPATMVLDTGAGNIGIAVTNAMLNSQLSQQYKASVSRNSLLEIKLLSKVEWSVGGSLHYRGLVILLPNSPDNGPPDALIGTQVMECYKVTIDYPDQKVFLRWDLPLHLLHNPADATKLR
jgi:predicted aspartyl protease